LRRRVEGQSSDGDAGADRFVGPVLSVPNTHPARSRSEPVLVDDAAEDFVPS
jgi:hypothetical protein